MIFSEKIQQALRVVQTLLLFSTAAALVLHLDLSAADPLAPKTLWAAGSTAGLACLALARFWWGAKIALPPPRLKKALALLLLALSFSFFLSPLKASAEIAWNGWLIAALLFLTALDWFSQEIAPAKRFLEAGTLAMLLCLVWQALQLLDKDPSVWGALIRAQFGGRVAAGLGNPNFLAGLLVLLAPLALARFWDSPQRLKIGLPLMALGWLGALLTGSKAAVFAVGFEFFCLGHLLWHSDLDLGVRRRIQRAWIAAGFLGSALLAVLPATRLRLWQMLTGHSDSFGFRWDTWAGSLKIWREHLFLGGGPGTFFALYPGLRNTDALKNAVQSSYEVTQPENWIAQSLAETGLFGLAAWLFFLWVVGKPLWRAAHELNEKEGGLALGLCLGLGGSLAMNFFALDFYLPQTFWFFTLAAGLAAARFGDAPRVIALRPEPYASVLVSLVLIFAAVFISAQAGGRWIASRELEAGKRLARASNFKKALPRLLNGVRLDPANAEAHYFYSLALADNKEFEKALSGFESLSQLAPDYVLLHANKAKVQMALGQDTQAQISLRRQLKLNPWYKPAWVQLVNLQVKNSELKTAAATLKEAAQYFEDDLDFKNNYLKIKKVLRTRVLK